MSAWSSATLPKIELHAHLNGSVSLKTMKKLHQMKQDADSNQTDESWKAVVLSQPTTMTEVFKYFPIVQKLTETKDCLVQAVVDVIHEFHEDGIVYLELRTTPKKVGDMTKYEYIKTVHEGIEKCACLPIVVRILLSIDRRQSAEEASETVDLAEQFAKLFGKVVGIDLSGDPSYDGQKFLPVLRRARHKGLKVSIHLAEVESTLDEIDALLQFAPDRIGHGSFLHREEKWVKRITDLKIPFEICLTSNMICMTTTSYEDSHFKFWKNEDVPVALCTDDKGLMDTSLSKEYDIAARVFSLGEEDMKKIVRDSFKMCFLSPNDPDYEKVSKLIE